MALRAQYASLQDYLDADDHAERMSEYHFGGAVAMAGGTANHARIALAETRANVVFEPEPEPESAQPPA